MHVWRSTWEDLDLAGAPEGGCLHAYSTRSRSPNQIGSAIRGSHLLGPNWDLRRYESIFLEFVQINYCEANGFLGKLLSPNVSP